jgi:predicted amidophosphoribosyltransferase
MKAIKICAVCGKPHNSIWDYCPKCLNKRGFKKCYEIEQEKKKNG